MERHNLLSIDGVQTYVYDEGQGPAIVMLHGVASTAECWRFTFDALKSDHRVIAPDLPGHGNSEAHAFPYSLDFFVGWLENLLDTLEVQQATLMGNSMGGAVALAFAEAHPDRTRHIVLANPLGVSSRIPWDSAWRLLRRMPHGIMMMLTGKTDPHLLHYLKGRIIAQPDGSSMAVLTRMMQQNLKAGIWSVWAGVRLLLVDFLRQGQRRAFARRLRDISAPTLITWGRFDGLLPVRNATEAKAHMPNARIRILGKSAHMPMLEEPETFEALVRDFLQTPRRIYELQPTAARQRQRTTSD